MKRLALIPAVLMAGLCAGQSADLDRASAELAASLVLGDLREELRGKPADPAALCAAMLADPAANADPADAERNMALAHSNALARAFADEAHALFDRLAAPVARQDRFSAAFLADAETAPPDAIAEASAAAFPAAFRQAREEAVRRQAETLQANVRPSPDEVESRPREELARDLVARIEAAQGFAVFRENRTYIEKSFAGPILDDAFAQRDAQHDAVRRAGPSAPGFAPSAIATNLVAALFAHLAERRAADSAAFVYGPFPSSTGEVARAAAEERAAARFAEAAAAAPVPFDEAALERAIASDPAAHRRRADSLAVFEPALRDAVRSAASSDLLSRAPAAERDECAAFLRDRAAGDALAKPVADRVRAELLPRLDALRAGFARKQFETLAPPLAAGIWVPDETEVDAVCAVENDFRKTLRAWRRAPVALFAMIDKLAPEEQVLEETAALFDKAVPAAFEPGAAARGAQHRIVDGLYGDVKRAVQALGDVPPLERVVSIYKARTALAWADARPAAIGLAAGAADDGRYLDLFPSTLEKIELLAKTILEEMEREKAQPETPPDPTPPQPDSPPEEPKAIAVECDLVFDRKGDEFEVSVRAEARELGRFTCPADPAGFQGALGRFAEDAAGALAALLRERTKQGTVQLTVNLVVRNGLIYWAAVSGVSESVREAVKGFGDAVAAEFSEAATKRRP